uniref:Alcohol dehydrogenase-like N-terminal domain-containing protein n=1 Tax=Timspurckia oligopyrenoides TaxID=708627 RepID=A0A7S0ZJU2_9RHOD|mmetsp:Transcript_7810/g.14185  ORF Transcript_7810/g.14185 Transcript_7810/m.14185 type:complete len:355 (+) Transcript_7810:54-1118(+)
MHRGLRAIQGSLSGRRWDCVSFIRGISSAGTSSSGGVKYTFSKSGLKPVLSSDTLSGSPSPQKIQVEFLASGLSQVDIQLATSNSKSAKEDSVAGSEGVARVHAAGERAGIPVGAFVIPRKLGLGTFREYAEFDASDLVQIPPQVPLETAASLSLGPAAAWRLLNDSHLKSGSIVAVYDSHTALGQALVQLCAFKGYKTICVLPDSKIPFWSTMSQLLKVLGADLVIPESKLLSVSSVMKDVLNDFGSADLCVTCGGSGESASASLKPLMKSGAKVVALDETSGLKSANSSMDSTEEKMWKELLEISELGRLKLWLKRMKLVDVSRALEYSQSESSDRKVILFTKAGEKYLASQ